MKAIYCNELKLNYKPVYEKHIAIDTAVANFETFFIPLIPPPPSGYEPLRLYAHLKAPYEVDKPRAYK